MVMARGEAGRLVLKPRARHPIGLLPPQSWQGHPHQSLRDQYAVHFSRQRPTGFYVLQPLPASAAAWNSAPASPQRSGAGCGRASGPATAGRAQAAANLRGESPPDAENEAKWRMGSDYSSCYWRIDEAHGPAATPAIHLGAAATGTSSRPSTFKRHPVPCRVGASLPTRRHSHFRCGAQTQTAQPSCRPNCAALSVPLRCCHPPPIAAPALTCALPAPTLPGHP